MRRRDFLRASSAALAGAATWPARAAGESATPLEMPPLIDTRASGRLELTAQYGRTRFRPGSAESTTVGFNQAYLGPTVRLQNGPLAVEARNALRETINVHWHGALVPGIHDGPHSPIAPGAVWSPEITFDQSPATLWYHSHVHRRTAPQVYWGLAGALQITDGRDDARGLPSEYGVDDLMLAIQDRRFDAEGRMVYSPTMTDVLNGFYGDRVLVNGQSDRVAVVPEGIVRLRLLNASNARIYTLSFSDRRPMRLVATDSGFVGKPTELTFLRLAPAERAEVLVDFSDGRPTVLQSTRGLTMTVLRFATDGRLPVRITAMPDSLDEDAAPPPAKGLRSRRFGLNMGGDSTGMSHDMTGSATPGMDMDHGTIEAVAAPADQPPGDGPEGPQGMVGAMVHDFGVNGRPFDMAKLNFTTKVGSRERWKITGGGAIEHPFHVHGCRFRVLSEGGGAGPSPQNRGWKDVVLITGETEIEMQFLHEADPEHGYMLHCHILEHEDAGMMAQFAVV